MKLQREQPRPAHDNQLPLINIVFLMLVFFLLAGTIAPRAELDVVPPQVTGGQPARMSVAAIYLSANGQLAHAGQTANSVSELITMLAGSVPSEAVITADRDADALLLLDLVAGLRAAGTGKIEMTTLKGAQ